MIVDGDRLPGKGVMVRTSGGSARGIASREAILQAAVRVIGRVGLSGASLSAVATDAGTSKPALLYHFGSRENLLREVAVMAVGVFKKLLDAAGDEGIPGRKRTEAGVAALFSAANRTLLVCVHELVGLGMRDPEVGRLLNRALEDATRLPAKSLAKRHGNHADSLARSLIMSVHGHVELWLCSGEEDPSAYVHAATRTAMAILAAPTSP
jgi:AcrR family transcriptional regulator